MSEEYSRKFHLRTTWCCRNLIVSMDMLQWVITKNRCMFPAWKLPLWACCQPVGSLLASIWLLAGFENWGIGTRGLLQSRDMYGLNGKQVPLPLCHHYMTSMALACHAHWALSFVSRSLPSITSSLCYRCCASVMLIIRPSFGKQVPPPLHHYWLCWCRCIVLILRVDDATIFQK